MRLRRSAAVAVAHVAGLAGREIGCAAPVADVLIVEAEVRQPEQCPMPERVRRLLRPRERISVSHWCDRHRYLDRRFTAEPGPWRTAKVPYLREPLDAFADPHVEQLTFVKCSRVGGTEWQNNVMAWSADCRPMPTMYVQPERPDVADELRGRLRGIFETSPQLQLHIPGGEWCTETAIRLDAMTIYGAWSTSPNTMIRKTIGLAVFDEIDNCEQVSGPLGNTLKVLRERLVTYGHRGKLILDGTPKGPDGSGWRSLQSSDCRRPHVPCPHCGTLQVLDFDRIVLVKEHARVRDPDRIEAEQLARYQCEGCDELIDHRQWQAWMISRVVWIPRTQTPISRLPVREARGEPIDGAKIPKKAQAEARRIVDVESLAVPPYDPWDPRYADHVQWRPLLDGEAPKTRRRGYWINVLYSPWATRTWSHILAEWFRVHDKPDEKRVFINSWLAQPWEEVVERLDWEELGKKRQDPGALPEGVVPNWAKVLVMGADVQLDYLFYAIRAWGVGERSHLVRHGTVETFEALYQIAFHTGFPLLGDDKQLVRCYALGVDTGYAARIDEAYAFARRPGVVAMKGVDSADYRTRPTQIEHLPRGGTKPFGVTLQLVNTSLFKTKVHRLANLPADDPAAWSIHRDATDEYLKQFTNEHQVWETHKDARKRRRAGRRRLIWQTKTEGARVDYLDCEVYGAALADILNVPLLRDDSPLQGTLVRSLPRPGARRPPPAARSGGVFDGGGFLG